MNKKRVSKGRKGEVAERIETGTYMEVPAVFLDVPAGGRVLIPVESAMVKVLAPSWWWW